MDISIIGINQFGVRVGVTQFGISDEFPGTTSTNRTDTAKNSIRNIN